MAGRAEADVMTMVGTMAAYGSSTMSAAQSALSALANGNYSVSFGIQDYVQTIVPYPLIEPSPIAPISVGPVPTIGDVQMPVVPARPDIIIDPAPGLVCPCATPPRCTCPSSIRGPVHTCNWRRFASYP